MIHRGLTAARRARDACATIVITLGLVGGAPAGVVTWDGGGDGTSWHDELNWSGDQLPGAADDVVIDAGGGVTVTHSLGDDAIASLSCAEALVVSNGSLAVSGASTVSGSLSLTFGTLDLGGATTIAAYSQSGGTLQGSGDVTVTGTLTWTGGLMTGTGKIIANGTLDLSGTNKDLRRDLDNNGTATWSDFGQLWLSDSAVFTNKPGAIFEAQNDTLIWWGVQPFGTFDNRGTFRKTAGAGQTDIRVFFQNSGTIDIQTGTALFREDSTHTGTLMGDGTVQFNTGTHLLDASSSLTVANVLVSNGTTSVLGDFTPDTVTLSFGTLDFTSSATLPTYTQTGGTLQGAGDFTVTGTLTWAGGLMTGAGKIIANGTLDLSGTNKDLRRDLDNNGTATWSDFGQLWLSDSAVFTNKPGAIFEAQNDTLIWWNAQPFGTFDNQGTFRKAAGTGVTDIRVFFQNSGTLDVQTGTALFRTDSTHTGTLMGAGSVEFNVGTHLLDATSSLTVPNVLVSNGTTSVLGDFTPNTVTLSFGTLDFTSSATLPTYSQSGGTLQGTGDFTVTGTLTWAGGLMTGAGKIIANGTLDLSGTNKDLRRDLDNNGTATWSDFGQLWLSDSAVFTNKPGAIFEAQNDTLIWWNAQPFGTFDNQGTFRKTPGVGTTDIRVNFHNSGTVDVQTGTLLFREGDYLQTGGATIVESTFEMVGVGIVDLQSGALSGNGLVIGNVTNNGVVAPGGSAGTLTIDGNYTQTPDGTLSTELGGTDPGAYDVLAVDGDAFLAGLLTIPLLDGFFPQVGQQFTILTTTGTRNDAFDLVDCPAIYQVVYLPAAVRLDVTQSQPVGDVNCDGNVNVDDLLLLLAAWGPCPGCRADLDGDGDVDVDDLLLLLANWTS